MVLIAPLSSRAIEFSNRDALALVLSGRSFQIVTYFLGRPVEGTRLLLLFGNAKEESNGLSEKNIRDHRYLKVKSDFCKQNKRECNH